MKRLLAAVLVLTSLLLSGCGTGGYISVEAHIEQQEQFNSGIRKITNYDELLRAMKSMVRYGKDNEVFIVENYNHNMLTMDIPQAERMVQIQDPLGAYAVEKIDTEMGVNGGQTSLAIQIDYRHSKTEIVRIRDVAGVESAKLAIASALNQLKSGLVLHIKDYKEVDFEQMVEDYAMESPDKVIETPRVTTMVYPDFGKSRVVELKFTYQTSRDKLRDMQNMVAEVFTSANLYISGDNTDLDRYSHLYSFLMGRYDYVFETSITPAYSLLCHGVGNSWAFATVFAAMCEQADLPCLVVTGSRNGEPHFWNIVYVNERFYHLDLLRCLQEGGMYLRADDEMRGYVWDYSGYPACGERSNWTDNPGYWYPDVK